MGIGKKSHTKLMIDHEVFLERKNFKLEEVLVTATAGSSSKDRRD